MIIFEREKRLTPLVFIPAILFILFLEGCQGAKAPRQKSARNYEYGILYLQSKKYNLAQRQFQRAKELNPDDSRIYNGLGLTYYFQSKFNLSADAYQRAIKLTPDYPDAYNNLAATLAKQSKWMKVIEYADKALSFSFYKTPEFAHYNKGVAYYNLQEYQRALKELEISLELDPNYTDTHYQLGLTLFHFKKYSRATEVFQRVLQLTPITSSELLKDPLMLDARFHLALSYYHNKQKKRAEKEFQKVTELAPDSPQSQEAQKYLNSLTENK